MNEIIYEKTLNHEITQADRRNRVGFEEFMKELQKYGWADKDRNGLKSFKIKFSGNGNIIVWKAILINSQQTGEIDKTK